MIPKVAACIHAVDHGVGSAHILDGRVPHVVLLELFSDAGIGTMVTEERADDARSHLMPTYAPAAGHLRPRRRHRAVGRRRASATSTSSRASPSPASATATRRSPTPSPSRPARLLHVSNLFRTEPGEEVAATLDLLVGDGTPAGGQVFFANSGAEANECAIKLARKFGGPRAATWS